MVDQTTRSLVPFWGLIDFWGAGYAVAERMGLAPALQNLELQFRNCVWSMSAAAKWADSRWRVSGAALQPLAHASAAAATTAGSNSQLRSG